MAKSYKPPRAGTRRMITAFNEAIKTRATLYAETPKSDNASRQATRRALIEAAKLATRREKIEARRNKRANRGKKT